MTPTIDIRPWTDDDRAVLAHNDTPAMTAFLGGPEGEDGVERRHALFLRQQRDGIAWPFTVWSSEHDEAVGSVVYWLVEHAGEAAYECGWAIATRHQGRGYARGALRMLLEHAAQHGERETVYAFPRVDNVASSALARSVGFEHRGVEGFEYPVGVPIDVDVWAFALARLRRER